MRYTHKIVNRPTEKKYKLYLNTRVSHRVHIVQDCWEAFSYYNITFTYVAQHNKAYVMFKRLIPGEPRCEGGIGQESRSIRAHLKRTYCFENTIKAVFVYHLYVFERMLFGFWFPFWSGGSREL